MGDRLSRTAAVAGSLLLVAIIPFAPFFLRLPGVGPDRVEDFFLKIGLGALFALYAFGRMLSPPERVRFDFPAIALVIGAVFAVASAAISPAPLYSLNAALPWLGGIGLYAMLLDAGGRRDLFPLVSGLLILQGILLSSYAIGQNYGFEMLPYHEEGMQKNWVIATFGHPNFLGSFMGPVFFLALGWVFRPAAGALRVTAALAALVLGYALFLARARGVWIGTALGLAVTGALLAYFHRGLFLRVLGPRGLWIAVVLAGAVLLAGVAAAGPTRLGQRIGQRLARTLASPQWESRIYYWSVASTMRSPTPPLGIGPGGFSRIFWDKADEFQLEPRSRYYRRNLGAISGDFRALDPGHVHNDYLEFWVERGIGGLLAHLAFVGYLGLLTFARIVTARPGVELTSAELAPRLALLGALICTLADSLLGFPLHLPCSLLLFWVLCALLASTIREPIPCRVS